MSFCWLVLIFQQLPGLKRAWPSPVLIAAPSQAWLVLTAVTWSGTAAAPPLEQVAWRKVLTAFRHKDYQCRDNPHLIALEPHSWIYKLLHIRPKCAVWSKWATQTPSHLGQSSVSHQRSLMMLLSNWNGISGTITAVLSPPFILTLYPLSLDFALTVVKAPE